MQIELFGYWRSSCSWRVRWALAHKRITYTYTPVNLLKGEHKQPAFRSLNPTGFVPAIRINNSEILCDSMAILDWLEMQFPGHPLLPVSPLEQARVRSLANIIACGTQPLQNLCAQHYHSRSPSKRLEYAQYWIHKGLTAYEQSAVLTAGSFSFGSQVTIADLCLIPQCYNARRFGIDLQNFPTISRIEANCLATRACQDAAPDKQSDAVLAK